MCAGYCGEPEYRILADLQAIDIPSEAYTYACCWSEICGCAGGIPMRSIWRRGARFVASAVTLLENLVGTDECGRGNHGVLRRQTMGSRCGGLRPPCRSAAVGAPRTRRPRRIRVDRLTTSGPAVGAS